MATTQPALFVADARGLDFLNSVATPVDTPVDWIGDGRGLVDWLRQAGLAPPDELDGIVALVSPGELDRAAGQARELREWFRAFVRGHAGRPVDAEALAELAPLERLLQQDEAYTQVVARAGRLALESRRRWPSAELLLIPIAEAIAQVVTQEDFAQVKACEGHKCTLMFVDRTRARARRWCSMGVCGNRAKVAAHRHRHKAD